MTRRTHRLDLHFGNRESEAPRADGPARRRLNLSKRRCASQRNAKNRYGQSSQCEFHTVLLSRTFFSTKSSTSRLRGCYEADNDPGGILVGPEDHAVVIDINRGRRKFAGDRDRREYPSAEQESLLAIPG